MSNEISTTIMNPAAMGNLMRFAEMMSQGVVTVPKHLQGHPADCLAVVMQAMRWGMDPFVVGQKTHVVSGNLGYEAQLVNAVVMASGAIKGRFHYEYKGTGSALECRVGAVPAGETEVVWGNWLKASEVKTKNSPLWQVNPHQQIGYLQVKNWSRLYCPGAILGVYTPDELEQIAPPAAPPAPRHMGDLKPHQPEPLALEAPAELINAAEDAALGGVESYRSFFADRSKEERRQLAARHDDLKKAAAEVDASVQPAGDAIDADGVIG